MTNEYLVVVTEDGVTMMQELDELVIVIDEDEQQIAVQETTGQQA